MIKEFNEQTLGVLLRW